MQCYCLTHDDFLDVDLINGIRAKLCFLYLSSWLGMAQCAIQSSRYAFFECMWWLLRFLWYDQDKFQLPLFDIISPAMELISTSRGMGAVLINKIACPGPGRIVGSFGCTSRQRAPSFPQLFRSSDIAEGIQCVARISWVAAFAVFVSRTTTCQIVTHRSIKQTDRQISEWNQGTKVTKLLFALQVPDHSPDQTSRMPHRTLLPWSLGASSF